MKYTHCILILVTMLSIDMTCVGNTNDPVDSGGKGRSSGNPGSPGNPGDLRNQGGTDGKDISGNQGGTGNPGGTGNLGSSNGTGGLSNQDGNADSEKEKMKKDLKQYFPEPVDLALVTNRRDGIAEDVYKLFQGKSLSQGDKEALWKKAFTIGVSDQGRATLVSKLIEAGVDPNKHLRNITASICDGYKKTVRAVVDSKKLDLSKEYNGETLLTLAVFSKQLDRVEILLQAGAKPDLKSIEWACELGKAEILQALIENLEDKKTLNEYITSGRGEKTLLYKAVSKGSEAIVKALLDAGANHNKGRRIRRVTKTPLALAQEKLKKCGSSKNKKENLNKIIKLLQKKGAQ